MGYKLFLDDIRNPVHCITYMHTRIGPRNMVYMQNDWAICRNYKCFVSTIESMGLPEFISFDHDLAEEHYEIELMSAEEWENYHMRSDREKTGYDCAKWLVDYCTDHNLKLPETAVHSMNPIGVQNITSYLKGAEKWMKKSSM